VIISDVFVFLAKITSNKAINAGRSFFEKKCMRAFLKRSFVAMPIFGEKGNYCAACS
jgi:hypothetical protein